MRFKKNLLTIVIMILCVVGMFFTLNDTSKNTMPNNFEQNMQMPGNEQSNNNFPGNMPPGNGFQGQMPNDMPPGQMNQMQPQENLQMPQQNKVQISTVQLGLLIIEGLIFSILLVYLLMSHFNLLGFKETFVNKDKILICLLSTILVCEGVVGANILSRQFFKLNVIEEDNEEYEEIDEGVVVNETYIDLSQYRSNITLKESKEYTLTGEFEYSVLIDSKDDVTIRLDNVTINSKKTAAIANINMNDFTVYLVDGSVNRLSDGGNSDYDGCLYSNGILTIDGSGTLYVNGNQDEGEGIATTDNDIIINNGNIMIESNDDGINAGGDNGGMITINNGSIYVHASGDGIDSNGGLTFNGGYIYSMGSAIGGDAGIDADLGYSINGGTVIGLGSDMLTPPSKDSKQLSISLNLDQVIENGNIIRLLKENVEILSFEADENFRTLVLSSDKLEKGTFELYANDEKIMDIEL